MIGVANPRDGRHYMPPYEHVKHLASNPRANIAPPIGYNSGHEIPATVFAENSNGLCRGGGNCLRRLFDGQGPRKRAPLFVNGTERNRRRILD